MSKDISLEQSSSKRFIANNRSLLKEYAEKNQEFFGVGIVVVNLLLLKTDKLNRSDLLDSDLAERQPQTIHQGLSYIAQNNFWYRMINMKIKQKYQIDLQAKNNPDQILIVFIKDTELEHFSIYTINLNNSED